MKPKFTTRFGIALFLFSAFLAACGIGNSENQPPKAERPKLIVKKWRLDSAHYRGLYRRYADFLWEKFLEAEGDEFLSDLSEQEIMENREFQNQKLWSLCEEEIQAMFFDFKPDGTFEYRYRGGEQSGTYDFSEDFDSLRLKTEASHSGGYSVSVPMLSDSVMKLTMGWRVPMAKEPLVYKVDAKYIPIN